LGSIKNAIITHNGHEPTSEFIANYCSSVLLLLTSHKNSEEDIKKVRMEDWRKLTSNTMTKFSYFVNAHGTTGTVATITIKELLSVSGKWKL
jgi:5-enolpyruvylshikimate-3-phosphate synthase